MGPHAEGLTRGSRSVATGRPAMTIAMAIREGWATNDSYAQ